MTQQPPTHSRRESARMGSKARGKKMAKVIARDGRACWVCGEEVDLTLRDNSARAASLDHVVELRAGGTHAASNLRLAHIGCNVMRDRSPKP